MDFDRWTEDLFGIDLSRFGFSGPSPGAPAPAPDAKSATAANPKAVDAKKEDSKTGDPKTGDPKTGDPKTGDPKTGDPKKADPTQSASLGSVSEKYEAGSRGSTAIGNDSTGGWSYGKYQIATKTGTMKDFLDYVKNADASTYQALSAAGGMKGATDHTDDFVKAWDKVAKSGSLAPLEHGFIKDTHFTPQQESLQGAGLDLSKRDQALSDVVWSVSVQHGPESGIVKKALGKLVDGQKAKDKAAKKTRTDQEIVDAISDKDLIDAIYDERGATKEKDGKTVLKYFSHSTEDVQKSVAARYKAERASAQAELTSDQAAAAKETAAPAAPDKAP